jgi:uncharacterized protein (TIGR03382 family)
VVDQATSCLDPTSTFAVYAGDSRVVRTGERVSLNFWANRKNRGIAYEWTVLVRPDGANTSISHPRGSATLSTPYNYHYKKDRAVRFIPDKPGQYRIKLSARLVFDDDLYPGKRTAEHTMTLTVEGDPVESGCATGGTQGPAGLAMVLGLTWLLMRKREE